MYTEEEQLIDTSDEVLLTSSLEDPELFVHIVRRYEDAFLRKVRKVVWAKEDAEDIVQETFTKIYLKGHTFQKIEGASFRSWAYKILMNTACTRYRKVIQHNQKTAPLTAEHYERLPDTIHEESFGLEMSDYVVSIFARMPDHLAQVLELHFIKQLPQKVIAEREGVSIGAIKTRVHRAKIQFKELAEQYSPFI
jgi:RNA polymerase sigma-70 factor (ECF subfamily)